MNNRELYELMDRLGMIEDEGEKCCSASEETEHYETPADEFEMKTSKDLIAVMNFVDNLYLYNDLETIKKLLVAIIYNNNNNNK